MAKQVTNAVQFRDPIQPNIGVDRLLYVVKCDDGSMYEFQRMEDEPLWQFRSRGDKSRKLTWSTVSRRLPGNVEDVLDENLDSWEK